MFLTKIYKFKNCVFLYFDHYGCCKHSMPSLNGIRNYFLYIQFASPTIERVKLDNG